jgi:hypothetical protein
VGAAWGEQWRARRARVNGGNERGGHEGPFYRLGMVGESRDEVESWRQPAGVVGGRERRHTVPIFAGIEG